MSVVAQRMRSNGFDRFGPEEGRRQAIEALKNSGLRYGPIYTPGSLANASDGTKGTVALPGLGGGSNWWGGSADPERGSENWHASRSGLECEAAILSSRECSCRA